MSVKDEPRIALVHDEFTRRGGAEYVFEELVRLYPSADVYALYASNAPSMTIDGIPYPIHTSFIQTLPMWFRRHAGRVLPLLPQAAEQFDFSQYDAVISSSSGFSKGVITRSSVPHVCYCHTPTRYLWEYDEDTSRRAPWLLRWPLRLLLHYLRMVDFAAAQRPDSYIANSVYTRNRITAYYRRSSRVVYPPVDTAFFTPAPSEKLNASQAPFLVVARLTPAKRIQQAIAVCEKLQFPLVIVGAGSEYARLKSLAGRHTTFVGKVSREELRMHYRRARALLQPGVEDFGMATAESLACGTPVIALGRGGVLEVVDNGKHGVLYHEPHEERLAEALRHFLDIEQRFAVHTLQRQALRFTQRRFQDGVRNVVAQALANVNNEE